MPLYDELRRPAPHDAAREPSQRYERSPVAAAAGFASALGNRAFRAHAAWPSVARFRGGDVSGMGPQGGDRAPAGADSAQAGSKALDPETFGSATESAARAAMDAWSRVAIIDGVQIFGPVATGGSIKGPALLPFLIAGLPRASPDEQRASMAVAEAFSQAFAGWQRTFRIPGLPMYPLFAAFPGPVAPPTPNMPTPLRTMAPGRLTLVPPAVEPHLREACESAVTRLLAVFETWLAAKMVINLLGHGPIPAYAPPVVPVGPVVGGSVLPTPGCLGG